MHKLVRFLVYTNTIWHSQTQSEILEEEMGSQQCCVVLFKSIKSVTVLGVGFGSSYSAFVRVCRHALRTKKELQCAWHSQKGKMHKGRGDHCWQGSDGQREVKTGHVVARLLHLGLSK